MTEAGQRIIKASKDVRLWARGELADGTILHTPDLETPDVADMRAKLGLTQEAFARRFEIPLGTLREWEQGRRQPESGSRNYLLMIKHNPEAVREALTASLKMTTIGDAV
jgi:putative transcriptional regulator